MKKQTKNKEKEKPTLKHAGGENQTDKQSGCVTPCKRGEKSDGATRWNIRQHKDSRFEKKATAPHVLHEKEIKARSNKPWIYILKDCSSFLQIPFIVSDHNQESELLSFLFFLCFGISSWWAQNICKNKLKILHFFNTHKFKHRSVLLDSIWTTSFEKNTYLFFWDINSCLLTILKTIPLLLIWPLGAETSLSHHPQKNSTTKSSTVNRNKQTSIVTWEKTRRMAPKETQMCQCCNLEGLLNPLPLKCHENGTYDHRAYGEGEVKNLWE